MNWRQPFWAAFGAIGGSALLLALISLCWTRSNFADADAAFRVAANEERQLENGNPYPSEANVRKMRSHLADYRAELDKLKAELGTRVLAVSQIAPNEFQTRLLDAITAATNNARDHKVKLPENFKLGFDEFVSTLPKTAEAPRLGQELEQIQLLLNLMIEARVDAVTMFRRVGHESGAPTALATPPVAATPSARAGATPATSKMMESRAVEFSVSASSAAARKMINQIASADDQVFIFRTVHIKNQVEKGPTRDAVAAQIAPIPTNAAPSATPALKFIVGEEHVNVTARVELIDFRF